MSTKPLINKVEGDDQQERPCGISAFELHTDAGKTEKPFVIMEFRYSLMLPRMRCIIFLHLS